MNDVSGAVSKIDLFFICMQHARYLAFSYSYISKEIIFLTFVFKSLESLVFTGRSGILVNKKSGRKRAKKDEKSGRKRVQKRKENGFSKEKIKIVFRFHIISIAIKIIMMR